MAKSNRPEAPLYRVTMVAYRRAASAACAARIVQEEVAGRDIHVEDDAALAETACGKDVETPELCGAFHRNAQVTFDGTTFRNEVCV